MQNSKLRILHNLARSGGTLVCKCLGCMADIVLLSEIHPVSSLIARKEGLKEFDPLVQAFYWHKIILPEDISDKQFNFMEIMQLIVKRCNENNKQLVIRDMTNVDFIGIPSLIAPSYRLQHKEILSRSFEVISYALVRHPIDLWLSQKTLPYLQNMSTDYFLKGYFEYAQQIQPEGFVRYEDFVGDPERTMQVICDKLQLDFDRNFLNNWSSYNRITGDIHNTRITEPNKIALPPRRPVEPDLLEQFRSKKEYWKSLELLDYNDG